MNFDKRTFTSKVSRRAFVLFVACALLPVSVLAFISLRQVTTELRVQSERRLRQASKAVGLLLHKRLLTLEAAIDPSVLQMENQLGEGLERPFIGVVLLTPDGQKRALFGQMSSALPSLTPEQTGIIATGETLLFSDSVEGNLPRFILSRLFDRRHPESGILQGEVNPAFIWVVQDEATLEYGTTLIVLDESGKLLISPPEAGTMSRQVAAKSRVGSAGQFTWNDGAREYLSSYWSLFLKNKFHTANWTIVLSRETSDVLAPIADFKRNFVLIAFLSLLIVLLLSFGQIRKILRPLERLQDATRRLALGRLDTRVEIVSHDEFEELGGSFNQMAGQLGRQFDALTMRSEITVALSRTEGFNEILRSCMEILVRHLNLSVAGVWLTGTDETKFEQRAIAGTGRPTDGAYESVAVGHGEIGRVAADGRPFAVNFPAGDLRWSDPAWSTRENLVSFVGHPLVIDGRVCGVMSAFATRPLDVIDLGSIASTAGEIAQGIARRRAAEALRGSEGQVRQLQKMDAVGRLAGGIAHDFNNLLTVIMGYSQILLEDLDPEDPGQKCIQIIDKTAVRAAELTKQLLAFSRKQVLAPKLMDLNAIVSGLTVILQRLIGESIVLTFTPVPDPGLVKVDRGQIEQVIVNLVVNARDAMPNGGRITLETAAVDLEAYHPAFHPGMSRGPHMVLKVTDTGTGMDAATRARIFEPFFTTKEPGKGTGLGLATVYGIISQSGGSIQVESELGRGTTFTLYFPRAAGTVEASPAPIQPVARGRETVLLVEDEHEVRTLLHQILENNGYVVLDAGRPSDALRIAENHVGSIHLLLTDMVMPEMSGVVLSKRLKAIRPEMLVLQMSGYTEYRESGTPYEATGTAFLQKPFTPDTLAREVRAVLDTSRAPLNGK